MAENKIDSKELFSSFDKAGNVPSAGFSAEQIKGENQKVKKTVEIIQAAFDDVKKKGRELFENFNVSFDITSVDNSNRFEKAVNAVSFAEVSGASNKNISIPVNFNFSQLAKLGSFEVYSIAFSTMYNSLLKNKETASSGNEVNFGKHDEKQVQNNSSYEPSVLSYIKEFLEKFFLGSEDYKNMDYSACASQVAMNLKQRGFAAEDMFENPKGMNLFAERFAKVSKLGYQQQATSLAGVFSKKELGSLQSKSDAEIKAFCEKFSAQFLQNSGLSTNSYIIEIINKNGGDLGNYVDMGENGQKIVINVAEIRKIDNPAEIVMTLAHELTHMVDSSINKADGKMSRKGFGLSEHNLVGSLNQNAPPFVQKMERVYYDVNPHERSARQGELVALEFMMQLQPDETMKRYINKSLKDFQLYQKNTLKSLQTRVDELFAEYNSSRDSLGYDAQTMVYIDKVMADLQKMKEEGLLDISNDLRALQESEAIKNKDREAIQETVLGE